MCGDQTTPGIPAQTKPGIPENKPEIPTNPESQLKTNPEFQNKPGIPARRRPQGIIPSTIRKPIRGMIFWGNIACVEYDFTEENRAPARAGLHLRVVDVTVYGDSGRPARGGMPRQKRRAASPMTPRPDACPSPPRRHPMGENMVSLVDSHPTAASRRQYLRENNLRFAHGLPPEWRVEQVPHGGARPFHQKSTCIKQSTLGSCVVQSWLRNVQSLKE
jgi:hypothetical protein